MRGMDRDALFRLRIHRSREPILPVSLAWRMSGTVRCAAVDHIGRHCSPFSRRRASDGTPTSDKTDGSCRRSAAFP
ncbi:hypothetical protein BVI1335_580038 [Burkholderia vietnamiensis]|nr:hypothetical protein BVI1335_580038 [Burkholderia vietnamiensis]